MNDDKNDQFAQTETPGTTITQTRPIEGYHREEGRTLSSNMEKSIHHKEMDIDKLVQSAVENQSHTVEIAQAQSHTMRQ